MKNIKNDSKLTWILNLLKQNNNQLKQNNNLLKQNKKQSNLSLTL